MNLARNVFQASVVSVCLLSATAGFGAQPKWYSGNSAEYPASQYLVGRGVGSTEEEARNRARGDLATIFEVRIEMVSQDTTTVAKSGKKEEVSKLAVQQVSAKTDKVISGVSIAEIWRDPETKDFYALAVLSRRQAAASMREEMDTIDAGVQQYLQAVQTEKDPFLRVAALSRALESSIRREGFQASLKVVDPSGRGLEAPISQVAIQARIDDTLKRIKIASEVQDDGGAKELSSLLNGGLAAAGFLAANPASAEYILSGKLSMSDLGRQGNWNWMRASIEVSLIEKASGRVRGVKTWPVKASAQDVRTARTRALIEIENVFKQELRAAIIEFAGS